MKCLIDLISCVAYNTIICYIVIMYTCILHVLYPLTEKGTVLIKSLIISTCRPPAVHSLLHPQQLDS